MTGKFNYSKSQVVKITNDRGQYHLVVTISEPKLYIATRRSVLKNKKKCPNPDVFFADLNLKFEVIAKHPEITNVHESNLVLNRYIEQANDPLCLSKMATIKPLRMKHDKPFQTHCFCDEKHEVGKYVQHNYPTYQIMDAVNAGICSVKKIK